MGRDELVELHYISPIDNLRSIAQHGLLCHKLAIRLNPVSIAEPRVQDRRRRKRVPQGQPLHDYVNLYIYARNPMLFRRQREGWRICVLCISTDVLDLPGVVVTDQNAASGYARFAEAPAGLVYVSKEKTFAESWKHPDDQFAEWRHTSMMCAEVLVPDRVEPGYIKGVYVAGVLHKEEIDKIGLGIGTYVNRHLFFK